MIPLFMPRLKMDVQSALIIALLVGIAGFVPARQALAQAIACKLTELAADSDSINDAEKVAGVQISLSRTPQSLSEIMELTTM